MHAARRTSTRPDTRRRVAATLLITLAALSVTLCMPAAPAADEPTASASAAGARWVGTLRGSALRSSHWVSGGAAHEGDFWFTVGPRGRLRGEAVVAYTPTFDTAGLNALLGYARGLTQAALGGIPLFGAFGAAQLNAFVGVHIRYGEPLAVRRGKIRGSIRNGRIFLAWAGRRPRGVRFEATLSSVKGQTPLTSGRLMVADPLVGTGRVLGGGHAVATRRARSVEDGVTEQVSSYWSAHRVGR